MISHEYKCIFIHIPRTGGTSVEKAVCGKNWWLIDKKTKHLTASESKKKYKQYWEDYFKFSFVRNPWDRTISLYHTSYNNGGILLDPPVYQSEMSGFEIVFIKNNKLFAKTKNIGISSGLGLDYFIDNYKPTPWEQKKIDYCDILNEDLDFVGRFENLKEDFIFIAKKIGLKDLEIPYADSVKKINKTNYKDYYDENCKIKVEKIYKKSIEKYNYSY